MSKSIYDDMKKSEKQVADYLEQLGLWWKYQAPVFVYDEKKRPRVWTPDFYIPKLGIYIEVCGTSKFDYEYRERIYDENGYSVVFVHVYKGRRVWKPFLVDRVRQIEESRDSKVMEMLQSLQS